MIKAIPAVQFIELDESDACCGSAGIYNLMNPKESRQLLERKLDRLADSGAEIVVSGNPGCLLYLDLGIRLRGMKIRARHPIELLAMSYNAGVGPGRSGNG